MHPMMGLSSTGDRRGGEAPATILQVFAERAALHPERVALRVPGAGGTGKGSITWISWLAQSRAVAGALVAGGVHPGQRVAVLAGNRPIWPIADLGILMAGGVSVGIYPTSAPAQVQQVLADSGAVAVIVDRREQLSKVLSVRAGLPSLHTVISEEPSSGALAWDALVQNGADAMAAGAAEEVSRRADGASATDDAILVYTSGSTGEPKGARISHGCLLASARSIQHALGLTDRDSSLSFLPFCHAAERIFGLYTRIACGMEAGLVEDHAGVWEAALEFGPTTFGGLPRFYEKVYETLRAEELASRGGERERWERVLELGGLRSRLRRQGVPVPARLEAEWRTLGEPIFGRVRQHFGGRIRLATSGGAAFPVEVAEYLDALGLTVLGAYGLTEHLCAAFNRSDRYAFDSAGPPMPGTEVRVADDGEIMLRRGPLTFSGYHGRPEDTRATFSPDGEWLLTGDLGFLGEDGCLRVTGRKKELIALSTGKKVAPLPIEALLLRDPLIGQAMLVGEGRKYVSALLVLRRPVVESWAREHGLALPYAELLRRPELRACVQKAVDAVNEGLSRTEQIRRFLLLEQEFSVERDELTPTLKIRRPVVLEHYRAELDALYLLPES